MGDPLSVAASAVSFIAVGLQATETLFKYYSSYKERDADLARTAEKLGDLLHSLQTIHNVVQTRKWRADENDILQDIECCISRCGTVIKQLQAEAQKYKQDSTNNVMATVRTIGRKVAYPVRKDTLKKLDMDVDYFRGNLSLALDALQVREQQNVQADLEDLKSIMKSTQAQHVASSIRSWLKAPDASIDHNAATSKRHTGTGQWFVQGTSFNDWLKQANSFLWLYGSPGGGKTVLCSTAIQYPFRRRQRQPGDAVAFFYFTFSDDSKQDASALLRALLLQLCGQIDGVEADLRKLKGTCNSGTPPVPTLLEYLRQTITRGHNVYILLDALDECPAGDKRTDVLEAVLIMRSWALPGLHLLVTSRDYLDIRQELEVEPSETVALQSDAVQQDIRRYVDHRLEHDRQLRRWGSHRDTIKQYLVEHADGMFRWVDCQLDTLRKCLLSAKHLQKCLQSLPKSLDATYERMLADIDEDLQLEAQRLLKLLCLSFRPLSVAEAIDAIAIDVDDKECFDSESRLKDAQDLLRLCPGLIEIHVRQHKNFNEVFQPFLETDNDDDFEKADNRGLDLDPSYSAAGDKLVRIAHFSVQEYLLSDRIKNGRAKYFALAPATDHTSISKACLIYLCNEEFTRRALTQRLLKQYPLAHFAARYWYEHHSKGDPDSNTTIAIWTSDLLVTSRNLDRWVRLYNIDHPISFSQVVFYRQQRKHRLSLYYAALLGLANLVGKMLHDADIEVNAQGGNIGTALQAASYRGHLEVVQLLLDRGAEMNAQGGHYSTALQAASSGGYQDVVQLLLDRGAEVNAQGGHYSTALQAASHRGHLEVVQLLLDRGAEVNAQGGHYSTALQAASCRGRLEVVQLLLDRGAEMNAQGGHYSSALQTASGGGYQDVVQLLLDRGAEVNAQGGHYSTALQAASHRGHLEVVQLLLDRGAEMNAQVGRYGSALQAASLCGRKEVVQLLLDRGAEVNAQGGQFGSALQAASRFGSEQIRQLLLARGAKVDDEAIGKATQRWPRHPINRSPYANNLSAQ